ncbi:MAG: c-type cytochrome [Thiomicrorhabdus sp.]|nr:c-type cytochrome [Thiomicrorhabdus sp.]
MSKNIQKSLVTLASAIAFVAFTTSAHATEGDAEAGKIKFKSTCVTCHGSKAEGNVGPKLAGQPAADIILKLTEFRAGKQRGPMTFMMAPMAQGLTEEEVKNVAAYVSGL